MATEIDIHTFKNFSGSGKERNFVSIQQGKPLSRKEIGEMLQDRCTITRSDIEAVLTAFSDLAKEQLSMGNRFYIPEIGYLSLSAKVNLPEGMPIEKVKGNYVSVRNIKFQPEKEFLKDIQQNTHFSRANHTTKSLEYNEEEIKNKIEKYIEQNGYINLSTLEVEFHMTAYFGRKWLTHFLQTGLLIKKGTKKHPIYQLNKE